MSSWWLWNFVRRVKEEVAGGLISEVKLSSWVEGGNVGLTPSGRPGGSFQTPGFVKILSHMTRFLNIPFIFSTASRELCIWERRKEAKSHFPVSKGHFSQILKFPFSPPEILSYAIDLRLLSYVKYLDFILRVIGSHRKVTYVVRLALCFRNITWTSLWRLQESLAFHIVISGAHNVSAQE